MSQNTSTILPPSKISWATMIATRHINQREEFINAFTSEELDIFNATWCFWAAPHQRFPMQDFTTWLMLGGRGSGKTRTGAEWVIEKAISGNASRIALLGETLHDVEEIMLEGDSGILNISKYKRRPHFNRTQRRLEWSNGAVAYPISAKDPDNLRGPQFDCAWCDELAKWSHAREAWDMLQFGLRLGNRPQQIITTTPRPLKLLQEIIARPDTITTNASTIDNQMFLAPTFFSHILRQYAGTRLGQQEIEGKLFDDHPDALWHRHNIEQYRIQQMPPYFDRIVVAVDPPVSAKQKSDECGIIVAGITTGEREGRAETHNSKAHWQAYIIADYSAHGLTPQAWANRAIEAYRYYHADRIVAETNQGGDMVRTIIMQIDSSVSYKPVFAHRGKISRAEPIAALYEQGKVHHIGIHEILEDQMCCFTIDKIHYNRSPDRVDALVWALTELMLTNNLIQPRITML